MALPIQAAFPQSPEPAQVVVTGKGLTGPAVTGAITGLSKLAAAMILLGNCCWYLPRWLSWLPDGMARGLA